MAASANFKDHVAFLALILLEIMLAGAFGSGLHSLWKLEINQITRKRGCAIIAAGIS
jgi:hypothetical protein